jgi:hypothetical protein
MTLADALPRFPMGIETITNFNILAKIECESKNGRAKNKNLRESS